MRIVTARWLHRGRLAPIRVIVLHDMEAPEGPLTAENCARYFATTDRPASAHVCVDNNSRVRCVDDDDTAWAAPGANSDGLQLECAGYMRQSRQEWLDAYSRDVLDQAAGQVAEWCTLHDIPPRWLTRAELKAGRKGLTTHADVSAVYKRSDHTDPGPGFPREYFLTLVTTRLGQTRPDPVTSDTPKAPKWPGRVLKFTTPYMTGTDVRQWQRRMRARGWDIAVDGVYGPGSRRVAVAFQQDKHVDPDGMVGRRTWRAAWEADIT